MRTCEAGVCFGDLSACWVAPCAPRCPAARQIARAKRARLEKGEPLSEEEEDEEAHTLQRDENEVGCRGTAGGGAGDVGQEAHARGGRGHLRRGTGGRLIFRGLQS